MMRLADKLLEFRKRYPSVPQAREALLMEVKTRLRASLLGEVAHRELTARLVDTIRRDVSIPAAERCDIVGMSKYEDVQLDHLWDEAARLAAIEQIERSLMQEFPRAPHPYETLLEVAQYSDDKKARALAGELANMAFAPAGVRDEAKLLLSRCDLVGTSVADLLPEAQLIPSGSETIIYAWSGSNPRSLAFVGELLKHLQPRTQLIGINVDRDRDAGQKVARAQKFPEPQLYDAGGEYAKRLKFGQAPLAYIAGIDGKIRTVAGIRELTVQWMALSKAKQTVSTQSLANPPTRSGVIGDK